MKAWVLNKVYDLQQETSPLELSEVSIPIADTNEILIKVSCCGVCHTELDEIEGRTAPPVYPIIPGHQVIGVVVEIGEKAIRFRRGERVGVAWIYSSCSRCEYCRSGLENLCEKFQATGRDRNGGYAEYITIHENFAYKIPAVLTDVESAPLLCAGAIGYRSLKLTGMRNGMTLGLTGFGASGHLVLKLAKYLYPKSKIFVFVRDIKERDFAIQLGADWAGNSNDQPPEKANAIIDTTPAWTPVTGSLLHLKPGGRLIINAIRKESNDQHALLDIKYQEHLWMEKEIKTVANITRTDVEEFLQIAADMRIRPEVEVYPFEKANEALLDLKHKHVRGAKVLVLR
ncbi:MAG: zinc-dependent alcohol dehydrogenase family protein [Cyclobacteriaceae bacterium]